MYSIVTSSPRSEAATPNQTQRVLSSQDLMATAPGEPPHPQPLPRPQAPC